MSNILKSIGRAIKKIVKSPIFKAILVAAAVYFTGGLAAGAMGSTFAVGLPGISAAANALGITAGAFGAAGEVAAGAGIIGAGATDMSLGLAGAANAADAAAGIGATSAAGATDAAMIGTVADPILAGATDASLGAAGAANAATNAATTAGLAQPTTGIVEQGLAATSAADGAPTLAMQSVAPTPPIPEPLPITPTVSAAPGTSAATPFEIANAGAGSEAVTAAAKVQGTSIGQNLFTDFSQWWGKLSPESKIILGQAGLGAGKAIVGAIASKSSTDEARRQFDSSHGVPAPTKPSPYNGLVNSMFSNPAQRPVIGGA